MSSQLAQRKKIFINKAFQGRLIIGVFALILLSGLCSALTIYLITGGDLQAQTQTAHVNIVNSLEKLGLSLFIGNLIALTIAGSISVFMVLYASHKIAGPLYRFEKICEQIGDDQLDSVTALRANDQLQELGQAFSVMATKLRNRKDQRLQWIKGIEEQVGILSKSNLDPEVLKQLTQIQDKLEKLKQ